MNPMKAGRFNNSATLRTLKASLLACGLMLAAAGCTAAPNQKVVSTFTTGEFGRTRVELQEKLPKKPARGRNIDRDYLLGHLRVGVLTLVDGYPDGASGVLDRVYDVLRMQGLNKDKTTTSVLLNEDLKIWKGEPFEQALAYSYIAAQYASQGSWDNARAAISGAMFHLADFGTDSSGKPLDTQSVVTQSSDESMTSYKVDETNFVLGHLISALANQQLGRQDEADAHYRQAVRINPSLQGFTQTLRRGQYNTILMVDYGQGPVKIGTGPDQAVATFQAVTGSDNAPLRVNVGDMAVRVPVVCDVNQMAQDHRWNNLEDMRLAKSHIGSALMITGGTLATLSNHNETQLVGAGLMLAGLFASAGAHADTRYCEAMPQRIYLVPLMLQANERIVLQVDGNPSSAMTLANLHAPEDGKVQFRVVRLLTGSALKPWAVPGQVYYSNPYALGSGGLNLPYILGGACVRPPTPEVLASYQASGFLRDMTFNELRDLYLAEDIEWENSPLEFPGLHVLEGGKSLMAPLPGTTGYQRLFCQVHPPYRPKSEQVRAAAQRIRDQLAQENSLRGQ